MNAPTTIDHALSKPSAQSAANDHPTSWQSESDIYYLVGTEAFKRKLRIGEKIGALTNKHPFPNRAAINSALDELYTIYQEHERIYIIPVRISERLISRDDTAGDGEIAHIYREKISSITIKQEE